MSNLDLSWSFSWTEITAIVYYIVTIIKDVTAYFETTSNFIKEMEVKPGFQPIKVTDLCRLTNKCWFWEISIRTFLGKEVDEGRILVVT